MIDMICRCLLGTTAWALLLPGAAAEEIVREWLVDHTWSAHPSSPPILVTAGDAQYLAYYNAQRRLTLAWRELDEETWQHRHFPVVTRWATRGHALIGLAVDTGGHIHLVPYRRDLSEQPQAPPNMIYFRSTRPHDPASMEPTHMVATDEPNPGYPVFLTAPDGTLYFEFRDGGSGRGNQQINRYDTASQTWHPTPMLLDGRGEMSAYGGPRLGPDGNWHCHWMWRNTPMADTNHTLSYMVSADLISWRSACGTELELPVDPDHPLVVVDPAKPQAGLLNPLQWIGHDGRNRPVITYHLYAPCGNSAIYAARFDDGAWKRVAAHVWDFRWEFAERGSIQAALGSGAVRPAGKGRLELRVWSEQNGSRRVVLDEATLEPLASNEDAEMASPARSTSWRNARSKPEIDFPLRPMRVQWLPDHGRCGGPDIHYVVRWEAGPTNQGDSPVPEPWPDAAPLRVFEVRSLNRPPDP